MPLCTAKTRLNEPCQKPAIPGITFCNIHNPDRKPYSRKPLGKARDTLTVDDLIKMQSKILKKLSRKSTLSTKELQSFSTISNSLLKAKREKLQIDRIDKVEKMLEAQTK